MRTKATINRLRMYKNFKPTRNAKGKIIRAAPFQSWNDPGTVARVEPHRKWFGNTRVIGQQQLQQFQEYMGKAIKDPFQVVMRQTRLPSPSCKRRPSSSGCTSWTLRASSTRSGRGPSGRDPI